MLTLTCASVSVCTTNMNATRYKMRHNIMGPVRGLDGGRGG